jgi:hypothetical protein
MVMPRNPLDGLHDEETEEAEADGGKVDMTQLPPG